MSTTPAAHRLGVLLGLFASGCAVVPPVLTPQPPPVHAVGLTVRDAAGPVAGAMCGLDGATAAAVGPSTATGTIVFNVVPLTLRATQLVCTAAGYQAFSEHRDLTGADPEPTLVAMLTPILAPHTPAQIADMQGDLMLWIPALAPHFVDGVDPVTGIHAGARGIDTGWVWTVWTPLYPPDQRQQIYAAAKAEGYTHLALPVTCGPGPGYHGLRPMSVEDCAGWGELLTTVLRETRAAGLISVCAGVSSTVPALTAGLDPSLCDVAMTDWDDWDSADCQIEAVAAAFPPTTPIYFEQPFWVSQPAADACTPSGLLPTVDGGAWIRAATRRHPNVAGVLLETNRAGLDADTAVITAAYRWWRDLQVVLFETDTYQKFWDGLPHDDARVYNDTLRQRTPTLRGFMSGGTTHTPPSPDSGGSGTFAGELDLHQATLVHLAGDFAEWAQTTTIQSIAFDSAGLHIEFSKLDGPDRWPDVPFGNPGDSLQYTIGLAEQINGQWYASAPIQMWYAEPHGGGDITIQDLHDGTHRGQIQGNWFYDSRWDAMRGYQPKAGETIGLFLCAGNCRDGDPSRSFVHERSNVVLLPLPAAPGIVVSAR